MSERNADIRISSATEAGFCIWEGGEIVAALTSRSEVAEWIERRLGHVPGELDREEQDRQQTVVDMPNVMRQQQPKVATRLWGRS